MYRINPFTYVVEGFLGTTLANAPMKCDTTEIVEFNAPNGTTCSNYLADYIKSNGGYLVDADNGSSVCQYCTMDDTNMFLKSINVDFDNRWRDFGFLWAYIIFNCAAAVFFYWLGRVPKSSKVKKE